MPKLDVLLSCMRLCVSEFVRRLLWYVLGFEKSLNHALFTCASVVEATFPDEHLRPFHAGGVLSTRDIHPSSNIFLWLFPLKSTVFIHTGEHDLNGDEGYEQRPEIEKIINHPDYSAYNNHDYDVALIKLKTPIAYNSRVRPVCLPKFDFDETTSCYISGWGHTQEGGDVPQVGS